MANGFYNSFLNNLLGDNTHTQMDLLDNTVIIMMIDAAVHTTNFATDVDFADLTADSMFGDSSAHTRASGHTLATKTVGSVGVGVFDADNAVLDTLATGDPTNLEEVFAFVSGATDALSPLICNWDTATGLPFTPNGGDANINFAAGGILTL